MTRRFPSPIPANRTAMAAKDVVPPKTPPSGGLTAIGVRN